MGPRCATGRPAGGRLFGVSLERFFTEFLLFALRKIFDLNFCLVECSDLIFSNICRGSVTHSATARTKLQNVHVIATIFRELSLTIHPASLPTCSNAFHPSLISRSTSARRTTTLPRAVHTAPRSPSRNPGPSHRNARLSPRGALRTWVFRPRTSLRLPR